MEWNELLLFLRSSNCAEEFQEKKEQMAEWLPCIKTMFEYDQNNPYHQYDLWMHSVHTVLGIDKKIDDDMLYLAALLHDVGKPSSRCKGKKENDIYSHYYGHQEKSEQIVREEIIPCIRKKGGILSDEDAKRLLYYVKYHDDRVSPRIKHEHTSTKTSSEM